LTYLAIEQDEEFYDKESQAWLARNVSSIRVSSMNEGIEKAMHNQFLYIGINADNINYKPKLKLLRGVTNDPIFISTSTYTMQEQTEAIYLGADLFCEISGNSSDNINACLTSINRLNERIRQRKHPIKLLVYGNILLAPKHRKVFVGDEDIELTRIEFDTLQYLMSNHGLVLSYQQIYRRVWKNEYAESDISVNSVVKNVIWRLRKKIDRQDGAKSFIDNVFGVGFRFTV